MQVREKVTAKDESSAQGGHDAGSHENMLDTTVRQEPRHLRRKTIEVKEDNTVEKALPLAPRQVIAATTIVRLTRTRGMLAMQVNQKMRATKATSIKHMVEEDESVAEMTGIIGTADVISTATVE